MERTLIIFKPDAVHRCLVGRILTRFEEKGLRIAAMKLQQSPRSQVERHYEVHRGKPFYDSLVTFMTSGPVVIGVLEGPGALKVKDEVILINDVLIPPLATHGRGFSDFRGIMLPMDLKLVGVAHSHPSGALWPSTQDLNHFYGRIMVLTAYPFQSYADIGVFNSHGDRLPHEVVPDYEPQKDDISL